jgi:hypothetical protein
MYWENILQKKEAVKIGVYVIFFAKQNTVVQHTVQCQDVTKKGKFFMLTEKTFYKMKQTTV